jgi:acetyl esterase
VFCDLDTHDGLCRMLANASGCRVVSVGYRLAPEHPFPAAIEDSHGALQWALRHGRELGIDPARLAVGGDSAGATLAAVACRRARDEGGKRPALQLLFCPVTDVVAASASRLAFAQGYFFDTALLDWSLRHYCPDRDPADPWLSPLRARDFHDLPPAHIHTAEFDPFRDEGEAYAAALRQAGVPVHQLRHPGMIHHFYCMAGAIAAARDAVRTAGEALGAALG